MVRAFKVLRKQRVSLPQGSVSESKIITKKVEVFLWEVQCLLQMDRVYLEAEMDFSHL